MAARIRALSAREETFCAQFAGTNNGKTSALVAGYGVGKDGKINGKSAAVTACRLLKREEIRERVDSLRRDAANEVGATTIYCARQLKKVADRCIQEVKPKLRFDPIEGKMVETGEFVFSASGATRAINAIIKLQEILEKKQETGAGQLDVSVTVVGDNGEPLE